MWKKLHGLNSFVWMKVWKVWHPFIFSSPTVKCSLLFWNGFLPFLHICFGVFLGFFCITALSYIHVWGVFGWWALLWDMIKAWVIVSLPKSALYLSTTSPLACQLCYSVFMIVLFAKALQQKFWGLRRLTVFTLRVIYTREDSIY